MNARRLPRMGALALLVILATAGCAGGGSATPGSTGGASAVGADALADTRWQATALADGAALAEGATPTAAFGADGTLAGSGGCNRYSTSYTTSGNAIEINEAVASTMMACEESLMTQESAFLAALTSARTFALSDGHLTLSDQQGAVVLTFAAQSQDLEGTWAVTAYHDGASAVVSVLAGTTPSFEFTDATLSGTAGCNRINGGYVVEGASLTIGPLMATQMACAEPEGVMAQESAVIAALESAASFEIEGDALVLRRADGGVGVQFTRG